MKRHPKAVPCELPCCWKVARWYVKCLDGQRLGNVSHKVAVCQSHFLMLKRGTFRRIRNG